ncbi:hypothetical protein BG015_009354 [Linnemannia schmuckeri]|uniref:Uncharacterized protein n=1 Tax=Linnemannia schmuckeri TaxID=64567 RepID=A0A9P5SAW6_9FUNG|nr:hypothetical protein BG015_009354 [Linnemannia schmuckeri]
MGASLIATQLTINELVGALLVGASIILSTHSLSRMIFLRRSGSKYHLFPIINIAQFINEFAVFFLITTVFDLISFEAALWLNVINNICYFVTKPITMYLAYLRCSAVFPAFKKLDWLHYFLIGFRAIELFAIVIINIVQNYLCNGSVAAGTRCAPLAVAWTFRDAGAPIFRGYYILCEGIFYVKLFRTLKGMSAGKNIQLKQYRQLQTSLFTVDLILLIFMSIYRIIGIFDKSLPTYVYIELFSSTLTIFTLTEFGLNIRILFNTVQDPKTGSEATSSPSKLEMASIHAGSGGHSGSGNGGHGTQMTVSTTMGSAAVLSRKSFEQNAQNQYSSSSSRPRPLTQNSTSPLTAHAAETGYNSDYDLAGSGANSTTTVAAAPTSASAANNRPTSPTVLSHSQQRPSLQLQYQQQQLQLQQQLQYNQQVVDDFQDYIPYGSTTASTTTTSVPISHHTSQDWLRSQPSNSNNQHQQLQFGGATPVASPSSPSSSSFLRGHQSPSSIGGSRSLNLAGSAAVSATGASGVVTPPERSHARLRQN